MVAYAHGVRKHMSDEADEEMQTVFDWLAGKIKQDKRREPDTPSLLETLDSRQRAARDAPEEKDGEGRDDIDEEEEEHAENPTPLMQALQWKPSYADWERVRAILDKNSDWERTLAWLWSEETKGGPKGYSAIHIAANKQDEDGPPGNSARQVELMERIFVAAIRQGCIVNTRLGKKGGSIIHTAVDHSNRGFLFALLRAEQTVVKHFRHELRPDCLPDWALEDNAGLTPLGAFCNKTDVLRMTAPMTDLFNFLVDRLKERGFTEADVQNEITTTRDAKLLRKSQSGMHRTFAPTFDLDFLKRRRLNTGRDPAGAGRNPVRTPSPRRDSPRRHPAGGRARRPEESLPRARSPSPRGYGRQEVEAGVARLRHLPRRRE